MQVYKCAFECHWDSKFEIVMIMLTKGISHVEVFLFGFHRVKLPIWCVIMHEAHTMPAINTVGEPIHNPGGNQINPRGAMTSTVRLLIACIVFLWLLFAQYLWMCMIQRVLKYLSMVTAAQCPVWPQQGKLFVTKWSSSEKEVLVESLCGPVLCWCWWWMMCVFGPNADWIRPPCRPIAFPRSTRRRSRGEVYQ